MKVNKQESDNIANLNYFPHLSKEVIKNIKKFQLDSFLIAYEGWRRGLTLKWYQDESNECELSRLNSSTSGKFYSLTSPDRKHYFFRSRGDQVQNKTVRLCQNKEKTKEILKNGNVAIPQGEEFNISEEYEILKFAEEIGYPLVVKPVSGSMGRGVFINLKNETELTNILKHYKNNLRYKKVIVEKHHQGKEYRIYVVGNEAVSVINRIPANIIGDGVSTVKELISLKNKQRKKNPYLAAKPIKIDYEINQKLANQNLNENSILEKDQKIFLRELSNLSTGGEPIDETNQITQEVKQIAVDALKVMPSITHAGVDVIIDPKNDKKAVVLEINATAEIAFHLFPLNNKPVDLPAKIIDYYFPETINNPTTNFYFDYKSILEPLKTSSTELVKVTPAPIGKLYRKIYYVEGKLSNVGYLSWIKRQALMRDLHGSIKKINKNKVKIDVIGTDKAVVEEFINICKKGSKKSQVEDISSINKNINEEDIFKLGFEIKYNKKRKKKNNNMKSKKNIESNYKAIKNQIEAENLQLKKELKDIKASKSWKITKPLRFFNKGSNKFK